MIEEQAVVIATTQDNMATLEVERKSACGLCGQTRGCGNQVWGKLLGHKSTTFKAFNTIQAQAGQSVMVAIDERKLLNATLILYILPLIAMFIVSILAHTLWQEEFITMLGALLGLVLAWLWVKLYLNANSCSASHQPTIVRLVETFSQTSSH